MSVRASSWVWEHSASRGAARLVLLALADYAGADGGDAYPAVATIAHRCAIDERSAQRALRRLVESGELEVDPAPTRRGTTRYRLTFTTAQVGEKVGDKGGGTMPPPPASDPVRGGTAPPEPKEEPNYKPPTPTGSADGAPGAKLTPRQAGTNPRALRAVPDPHATRQAAARRLERIAAARRLERIAAARRAGDLCPPCAGDGWAPDPDGNLERCATCAGDGVRLSA